MTQKTAYFGDARPPVPSIGDVLREMKQENEVRRLRLVENWKAYLPEVSKWQPGMPGNPSCQTCKGLGYVSLDLPLGHPLQGKLAKCECNKT